MTYSHAFFCVWRMYSDWIIALFVRQLGLARVITLGLLLRHTLENRSNFKNIKLKYLLKSNNPYGSQLQAMRDKLEKQMTHTFKITSLTKPLYGKIKMKYLKSSFFI